ncbi:3'-5' RNA helicase YTHDC2-like [Convolutriloba macropyga]|uniref:3'-5' RNA helicase YTHDC2-like n=1 Tax=Convolutriloba macropyga TaxID=536237 RepID=UPI003F5207E1
MAHRRQSLLGCVPQIILDDFHKRQDRCSILVSQSRGQTVISSAERVSYERGATSSNSPSNSSIGVSGSGNGGLSASINKIDGQQQQQHSSQFQSEPQLRGLSNGNGGFVGRGMGGVGTTGGIQQTSPKDYANGRNAGTVGYQSNKPEPQSKVSVDSALTYCTTDVLLRTLRDPNFLAFITHVIVDDVHERKILGDFLLLALKHSLKRHPNLKLVLLSNSCYPNMDEFKDFFHDSAVICIQQDNLLESSESTKHVYLPEILKTLNFDSIEMKRQRVISQLSDEWAHVTKQWVELRYELELKRNKDVLMQQLPTNNINIATSTGSSSAISGSELREELYSNRNTASELSGTASISIPDIASGGGTGFGCAMPKSTVEVDNFYDGVTNGLRHTVDCLLFDIWSNSPLTSTDSLAQLRSIFIEKREVPCDFVHSHSGMTFCEIAASRGLVSIVEELLTLSVNFESSCAANAWLSYKWAHYFRKEDVANILKRFIVQHGLGEPKHNELLRQARQLGQLQEEDLELMRTYFDAHGEKRVNKNLIADIISQILLEPKTESAAARQNSLGHDESVTCLVFLSSYLEVVELRDCLLRKPDFNEAFSDQRFVCVDSIKRDLFVKSSIIADFSII